MLLIGLMSGTSQDGVDAALVSLELRESGRPTAGLRAFHSAAYTPARRRALETAIEAGDAASLCRLHADLGEWLAEATLDLLEGAAVAPSEVAAIGSHGHTVWHEPPDHGSGATLQLGDPARLAELTGIPVVSDFRAADVAASGQGAPLVPWSDRILFSVPGRARALQNLGGVGNVTWLPAEESVEEVAAFDTGPGNALIDAATTRASGGEARFDDRGERAARGEVDHDLLAELMRHPFLARTPPRSTGREEFGPDMVQRLAEQRGLALGDGSQGWDDLIATLTAFTASSIAEAYDRWVLPRGVAEVVLTGGGAHNAELVREIQRRLSPLPVHTGAEALGMDPDAREAAAFGILAWGFLSGQPTNVPSVTGASGPRCLGSWTPAPSRAGGPPMYGGAPWPSGAEGRS